MNERQISTKLTCKAKFYGYLFQLHQGPIFAESFYALLMGYFDMFIQEPILRFLNLQLQRQRCSRLERFSKQNKIFLFSKRARLPVAL
jgi:hypothetical protein